MKVYITKEQKEEWQIRIYEIEKLMRLILRASSEDEKFDSMQNVAYSMYGKEVEILQKLLSYSIVLPVESSFDFVNNNYDLKYKNGVIIKK